MTRESIPPRYFDEIYSRQSDPWNFVTSEYEAAKYADTLRSLRRVRYRNGFEIGCSIGVLTRQLVERCQELLAVDVVGRPLIEARKRCRDFPHVRIEKMAVPDVLPAEHFDLIVLSEVAYYWSPAALDRVISWSTDHLQAGGDIILVHWTRETDYPLTGDEVHDRFKATSGLDCSIDRREDSYRLTLLSGPETSDSFR
jgi:cyclopropane fatty-acyl-phospholipid synthase-like methyltransferase